MRNHKGIGIVFPYSFFLKPHRSINPDTSVACYGIDCQLMLLGKRAGEDVRASGADGCSGKYVPSVMLFAVYPAPAHVGGQRVCRKPPFPAVPPLDECRRGKRCGGMHRGERMAVAVVGAVFPDAVLQGIRDACRGKGGECPLFQPFPVFLNQYGGQSCHGKQYRSHIARCAHRLARTADLDLLGGKRKRKEEQDV